MSHPPIVPPAMPSWEGMHPLVVHFPIALLLVAPLCLMLGFLPRVGKWFRFGALVMLILGTVGAYFATETGEASAKIISFTPEATETLEKHQDLAETVIVLFTTLTIVYSIILLAPGFVERFLKKRVPVGVPITLSILFLIVVCLSVNVLANTAHHGGRLVYSHRVENWVLKD